jgi:hypothetical protein
MCYSQRMPGAKQIARACIIEGGTEQAETLAKSYGL